MDYDQGRALIEELNALAVHPDLVYEHHWSPGQLIVWDNRCLTHRATDYDPATQRRVIRRCTVLGEVPSCVAPGSQWLPGRAQLTGNSALNLRWELARGQSFPQNPRSP